MNHRSFNIVVITSLALFVAFNALTWHFALRPLLTRYQGVLIGNLARLGYISDLVAPRRNTLDQPRRHLEASDYQGGPIDLLTIGDSFSNGGAGGPDRYYQDFIASRLNWRVLNLRPLPGTHGIDTLVILINSGLLQKMKVRRILLESTARKVSSRYARPPDWFRRMPLQEIRDFYRFGSGQTSDNDLALPPVPFINEGNLKYWWNMLMYRLDDCAFTSRLFP